jgi:hypothetical protein
LRALVLSLGSLSDREHHDERQKYGQQ